mmetsp:Transcript_30294/g.41532  ORF Transcript_30294/g.41532 Transcript_30294/m.41532 type:complete len:247 (-) Transcript_30294:395-1135(-)
MAFTSSSSSPSFDAFGSALRALRSAILAVKSAIIASIRLSTRGKDCALSAPCLPTKTPTACNGCTGGAVGSHSSPSSASPGNCGAGNVTAVEEGAAAVTEVTSLASEEVGGISFESTSSNSTISSATQISKPLRPSSSAAAATSVVTSFSTSLLTSILPLLLSTLDAVVSSVAFTAELSVGLIAFVDTSALLMSSLDGCGTVGGAGVNRGVLTSRWEGIGTNGFVRWTTEGAMVSIWASSRYLLAP